MTTKKKPVTTVHHHSHHTSIQKYTPKKSGSIETLDGKKRAEIQRYFDPAKLEKELVSCTQEIHDTIEPKTLSALFLKRAGIQIKLGNTADMQEDLRKSRALAPQAPAISAALRSTSQGLDLAFQNLNLTSGVTPSPKASKIDS